MGTTCGFSGDFAMANIIERLGIPTLILSHNKTLARQLWQEMKNAGVEPPFANDDEDTIGSPDEDVTTVMDVARFVHTKKESLSRHRTQMDPNGAFQQQPEDIMNRFM